MSYHYPDHVVAALARRLDQDRGAKLAALYRALASRYQSIEDALRALRRDQSLDLATGYALDRLGALMGEPRKGRDDERYRSWIRARGIANRTGGTADELLRILGLVIPTATLVYHDIPARDAEVRISASNTSVAYTADVRALAQSVVPAGVSLTMSFSAYPANQTFGFAAPYVGFGVGHMGG